MKDFEEQGGISFILLMLTHRDESYYIPLRDILRFWDRAEAGGRKSFTYAEIDKSYLIRGVSGGLSLHFLEQLQMDLASRD